MSTRVALAPGFSLRFKAALAFGETTLRDLAERVALAEEEGKESPDVGLSFSTLSRISSGHRPLRDYELALISRMLGVPEWFLRDGFEGATPTERDGADETRIASALARVETALTSDADIRARQHQLLVELRAFLEEQRRPPADRRE